MAPKLGEILICAKIIDQHQLESALSEQQKWGGKLGEILVNSGLCSEEMMVRALSRQLDVPRAELDRLSAVSPDALAKIPLELSQALDVLPIELRDNGSLIVVATLTRRILTTLYALSRKCCFLKERGERRYLPSRIISIRIHISVTTFLHR